jgi:hypothetical protein
MLAGIGLFDVDPPHNVFSVSGYGYAALQNPEMQWR